MPSPAELLGLAPASGQWNPYLAFPSDSTIPSGTPWWLQSIGQQSAGPPADPLTASRDPALTADLGPDAASGGWLGSVLTTDSPTSGGILHGVLPDASRGTGPSAVPASLPGIPPLGLNAVDPLTVSRLPASASFPFGWSGSPPPPSRGPREFNAVGSSAPPALPQASLDPWQAPAFGMSSIIGSGTNAPVQTALTATPGTHTFPDRAATTKESGNPTEAALDPGLGDQIADFALSIPFGFISDLAHTVSASGQAAQIEMQQPVDAPSADQATDILEQNVTGPLHRPQGRAGQFGAAFGTIANPLTFLVPGGIGTKLATAITSALGSEAAGQLTKGTWAEAFARFGGAILGGGLGASVAQHGAAAAESAANAAGRLGVAGGAVARPSPSPIFPFAEHLQPPTAEVVDRAAPSIGSNDLKEFRTRIGVPSTQTVAVARTNVPGMEDVKLEGASPSVWDKADLPRAAPGPIEPPPRTIALHREHAEQDIANQFVRAVEERRLKPSDLDGRTLAIHVSNPKGVCAVCRSGLASDKPPGVLKQLSERYRDLRIHVTVETQPGIIPRGPTTFVIQNGRYLSRSDR